MQNAGGRSAKASHLSFTRHQVERLTNVQPAELWCQFWALADTEGGHYLWHGEVKNRQPLFTLPGAKTPVPARELSWAYHWKELEEGEVLRPSCGEALCIRPDHLAARRGR